MSVANSDAPVDRNSQQEVVKWVLGFCEQFPAVPRPPPEQLRALRLAFLPATGIQSGALARAYTQAGFNTIVASRSASKAEAKRKALIDEFPSAAARVEAMELRQAAAAADVVFWLVPTITLSDIKESHTLLATLSEELQGKVIVDVTNVMWALDDSAWGQTSSTLQAQAALGPSHTARWTCAFKHVYYKLLDGSNPPNEANPHHVFVCGDDPNATGTTLALVDAVPGFKSLFAGSLKYSRIVELLSPLWLPQLERDNYGLNFTAGWRFGP